MPVVVSQLWEPEIVLDIARYITMISGGKSHPSLRTPDLDQSFLFYLFFLLYTSEFDEKSVVL